MCRCHFHCQPPFTSEIDMKTQTHHAAISSLLIVSALLSACDKTDTTLGQKVDGAVASSERAASAAKADMKEAANEVKTAASEASNTVTTATRDSVITTKVNAELVKDASLSAMKINVDSADGHVALTGSAPSDSARERAATLARAVEGVKDVDNRLIVEVKK
jgi:hyperosmotically inducible periplasmic protein